MVHFNVSLVEKENRYEIYAESPFTNFSNSPCDIALEHQADTSKRFVDAFKIHHGNTERLVSEVGSNESYHSPTAENIYQKWGCSVNAAKKTIINKTQDWIMSAAMPITKRYCTDLMSHNLCSLKMNSYTDTLFPKVKSTTGHKCAQIYTDRERFVCIMPLFSKEEVGT